MFTVLVCLSVCVCVTSWASLKAQPNSSPSLLRDHTFTPVLMTWETSNTSRLTYGSAQKQLNDAKFYLLTTLINISPENMIKGNLNKNKGLIVTRGLVVLLMFTKLPRSRRLLTRYYQTVGKHRAAGLWCPSRSGRQPSVICTAKFNYWNKYPCWILYQPQGSAASKASFE